MSEQKIFDQNETIKTLRAELNQARHDIRKLQAREKFMYRMNEHKPATPTWVSRPQASSGPGMPSVLLSDFHWGETVNASEIGGHNSYNPQIAERRLRRVVDTSIDLAVNHMVSPGNSGIVANLAGDMVSGNIHAELEKGNQGSVQQNVLHLSSELAGALKKYADKFGRVYVPCIHGNHGRTTTKPEYRATAVSNYDWQIYAWLQWYFKESGDDRITFHIPEGFDVFYSIYGRNYVLTHGDRLGVSGGDGIIGSIGPIMRGAHKIWESYGKLGKRVDTVLMGHWHLRCDPPDIIVNGTLKGFDGYSNGHRWAVKPPTQAMWWTHPRNGITFRADLYAEDGKAKTAAPFTRLP